MNEILRGSKARAENAENTYNLFKKITEKLLKFLENTDNAMMNSS